MEMNSLKDLFVEELKDLHSAETQILKAGPKAAKVAKHEELRSAIEQHMQETEQQKQRLEQILEELGESPRGKKCKGMQGVIDENKEWLDEDGDPAVKDAGIIVGLQKIEHYEMAGYGSAVTFARLLGDEEAARLLSQTLEEEERTDKKLTEIAESSINQEAVRSEAA